MPKDFSLKLWNEYFYTHTAENHYDDTNYSKIFDVNHKKRTDLFASAHFQSARLWRLENSLPIASVPHTDCVYTVACGERALATGAKDLALRFIDYETQGEIHCMPTGLRCVCVEWLDANLLAVAANTHAVMIYDLNSGQCIRKLLSHTGNCYRVAWFESSCLLASVSYDLTAKLWDISYDTCIATFAGHTKAVGCVVDLPRYNMIATGADDCKLKLWDKSSADCLTTMTNHLSYIDSMEYLENADLVLSGCNRGTLVGVDLSVPTKVYQTELGDRISGIEDLPGNRLVLTVMANGQLQAWEY